MAQSRGKDGSYVFVVTSTVRHWMSLAGDSAARHIFTTASRYKHLI